MRGKGAFLIKIKLSSKFLDVKDAKIFRMTQNLTLKKIKMQKIKM
jgi:hypothetical protein